MSQTRLEVEIMTVFLLQLSEHFNQPAEICVQVKLPKTLGCPGNYQQLVGRAHMVHRRMWSMGGGTTTFVIYIKKLLLDDDENLNVYRQEKHTVGTMS
jgi:hypothetical protein